MSWPRDTFRFFFLSSPRKSARVSIYDVSIICIYIYIYIYGHGISPFVRTKADALLILSRATGLTIRYSAINEVNRDNNHVLYLFARLGTPGRNNNIEMFYCLYYITMVFERHLCVSCIFYLFAKRISISYFVMQHTILYFVDYFIINLIIIS